MYFRDCKTLNVFERKIPLTSQKFLLKVLGLAETDIV
jgi:hypothetical protein